MICSACFVLFLSATSLSPFLSSSHPTLHTQRHRFGHSAIYLGTTLSFFGGCYMTSPMTTVLMCNTVGARVYSVDMMTGNWSSFNASFDLTAYSPVAASASGTFGFTYSGYSDMHLGSTNILSIGANESAIDDTMSVSCSASGKSSIFNASAMFNKFPILQKSMASPR